jgi:hypothetical protein
MTEFCSLLPHLQPSLTLHSLHALASNLLANGPYKIEHTPRRVRALFDGTWLFDTTSALWVWEHKYFPQFWIPLWAITPGILTKGAAIDAERSAFSAVLKGKGKSSDRVLLFEEGPLKGLVRFEFKAMGK